MFFFCTASVRKTAKAAIKKQNFQKPSKAKKFACFQDGSRVQAPGVLPTKNKLRELFYDRNPGDARVKVGSERKVATSPGAAKPGDVETLGVTTNKISRVSF